MGNRIPEEIVDQIRNTVDIVDVISEYVQLKKQGRNYFGLCPFHGEKSPSFSVSPDKQIYHCFGCGAGGNAISFLTKIEGISFIEAVKKLGERAHIHLPLDEYTDEKSVSLDMKMIEAHELLKRYYHHLLLHTEDGEEALAYLTNRGITKEVIETFEIGYAPDAWDMGTRFLTKKGYNLSLLEKAGLVIEKENGSGAYDRFRNRIMFPIHNAQGKVVAFSGRVLTNETPKYMNTPETAIFSKGRTLYHFHLARQAIRQKNRAILFEGFADVMAAVRSQFEESVATMGTALTTEQASMLRRLTDQIIICYDSDGAGIEASFKAATMLESMGCQVKIALMPNGQDPDEYTREHGTEAFKEKVIENALSFMSFKMYYYKQGKNMMDDQEKMNYIHRMLLEIARLQKPIEREHYMKTLSSEYSLSLDVLREELNGLLKRATNRHHEQQKRIEPIQKQSQKLLPAYVQAERRLLAHMLQSKEVTEKVQKNTQNFFNIDEHTEIIVHLYAYYEDGNEPDVSQFLSFLPTERLKSIVTEIAYLDINKEISDAELNDYFHQMHKRQIVLQIEQLKEQVRAAEKTKDYLKAAQIAQEITKLRLTINR
ncbi:MAG: DNA primase [Bacillaceae bacterium]